MLIRVYLEGGPLAGQVHPVEERLIRLGSALAVPEATRCISDYDTEPPYRSPRYQAIYYDSGKKIQYGDEQLPVFEFRDQQHVTRGYSAP